MIDRTDPMAAAGAFLFDLDGVITPTVLLHRRAWAETFDAVFARHGAAPYAEDDYFVSLDGRPRFEGVATLLAARGIVLPEGDGAAADGGAGDGTAWYDTIRGIGDRKNRVFTEVLARDGIAPYPGSLRLLDLLAERGSPLAIVSSSRNAEAVLGAAGLRNRFAAVVDGAVAGREGLAGKPAPDTFLRAAELLGVLPEDAAVFEDAASGVAAAASGGFGWIVGVDRGTGSGALLEAGAHTIVHDLEELMP